MTFQERVSFQKRLEESSKVLSVHPDRIPIILCYTDKTHKKFLVPQNLECNQLLYVFRKYSKLSPEQAVFIFTENNKLLDFTHDVSYVYRKYKNKDNFLYLYMAFENAFG